MSTLLAVAAPFTLWLAPVGTPFPQLHEEPAGPWTRAGTSGAEGAVSVAHVQSVERWGEYATSKGKAQTEEDLRIRLTLADPPAAGLGAADQRTLLVRGASPFGPGGIDFQVRFAVVDGDPAGPVLTFRAFEDPGAACREERFGRLLAQHESGAPEDERLTADV
jgi:hypothetical protein